MNNLRRKALQRVYKTLEEAKEELETICNEEQEAFDNIPESFEGTDRYEAAENTVDNLDYAYSGLEEVLECLDEAML